MKGVPATKCLLFYHKDKLLSTHPTLRDIADTYPHYFKNYEQVRNLVRRKYKDESRFKNITISRI